MVTYTVRRLLFSIEASIRLRVKFAFWTRIGYTKNSAWIHKCGSEALGGGIIPVCSRIRLPQVELDQEAVFNKGEVHQPLKPKQTIVS
jgi:hypothetical protein